MVEKSRQSSVVLRNIASNCSKYVAYVHIIGENSARSHVYERMKCMITMTLLLDSRMCFCEPHPGVCLTCLCWNSKQKS